MWTNRTAKWICSGLFSRLALQRRVCSSRMAWSSQKINDSVFIVFFSWDLLIICCWFFSLYSHMFLVFCLKLSVRAHPSMVSSKMSHSLICHWSETIITVKLISISMGAQQPEVYKVTSTWNKYTFICRKIIKCKKLLIITRSGCSERRVEDINKSGWRNIISVFNLLGPVIRCVCLVKMVTWWIPWHAATPGGQHGEWVLCQVSVGQCFSTRGPHCTGLNKDFISLELKPAE